MDKFTQEHFQAWLNNTVPESSRSEVEQCIIALLRLKPELIETHSWPEMRDIADRIFA